MHLKGTIVILLFKAISRNEIINPFFNHYLLMDTKSKIMLDFDHILLLLTLLKNL